MADKGGASRRRFRVLPTVLLTVAILGLPTAVYAWGRTSSAFEIKRVTVSGTELVARDRATTVLRDAFLGRNLFTVTAADVRRSLSRFAYVEDANVDRDFPDTLRVTVIEHRPAVYVLAEGGWFVLADDGFVIRSLGKTATGGHGAGQKASAGRASPAPDASTPVTPQTSASPAAANDAASPASATSDDGQAGSNDHDPTLVEQPSAALRRGPPRASLDLPAMALATTPRLGTTVTAPGVRAALRVLAALPSSLRRDVRVVQVRAGDDVTLRLAGSLTVRWGGEERPLAKRLSLAAVLAAYRRAGKDPSFVDVSVPDRVLARPILK